MPKEQQSNEETPFSRWWNKPENRRKTLDKRKERYAKDVEYRESIKESVYRRRKEYRAKNPPKGRGRNAPRFITIGAVEVKLVSSGDVTDRLGISRETFSRWEKKETIPCLYVRDEHERRWYPDEVITALERVVKTWRLSGSRSLTDLSARVLKKIKRSEDLPETYFMGSKND